jgi:hypothetical protein
MKKLIAALVILVVLAPGAGAKQPAFGRCMRRVHLLEAGERTASIQQAARSFCFMRYR